jgi:predicted deacetylase
VPDTEQRALCVSIHDVAPATWPDCLRLWQAVREVADIPLTWLVVPRYHGVRSESAAFDAALAGLLAQGHELALHGYTHLDTGPPPLSLREAFARRVFTRREGEFAAIGRAQAQRRLALGCAWFAARGWPVQGFVAPAWLLGEGAWEALRATPFLYTTTLRRFYCLRGQDGVSAAEPPPALYAPSLVYSARNAAGRGASRLAMSLGASMLAQAPLVRLSLHPPDARHPALLRHMQQLAESLLAARRPLTKAAFAAQWLDSGCLRADR